MKTEPESPRHVGSSALFGSVSAVMPDGSVERIECESRADMARAVLSFRERKGEHINVIDPWLPKREPNSGVIAKSVEVLTPGTPRKDKFGP